jgi:outer membrane protein OmpA-like peptidoglycan-associated protein/ABC-type nitrate/sulfonate/bicarbonate transport system substrate-binding protein
VTRSIQGAIALLILGLTVLLGVYFIWPLVQEQQQTKVSDAARSKGTLTVGVDNFVGYFPLCSPQMRRLMLSEGYKWECRNDNADYARRFKALSDNELSFAVTTVDAYLLVGRQTRYPGAIVGVIDQSMGGDAIVARSEAVTSLDDLKTKPGIKVAFTPDSPSHHLLKAVGVHFDIPILRSPDPGWRLETDGSSAALDALRSGKAQVAAVWEPEVTKALAIPGVVKLLGSEQTEKLIVDVLVAGREILDREPRLVRRVLSNYFRTLKFYRDDPETFAKDVADYAGVSEALAKSMLGGVRWLTMYENATQWLGISAPGQVPNHGLFETIEATVDILMDFGDVAANPLPDGDPRRLINSAMIADLFSTGLTVSPAGTSFLQKQTASPLEREFPSLDEQGWASLMEIGTLRFRPIHFQSGAGALTLDGKQELDKAVNALKSYPNFRVVIEGHTNTRGDGAANKALSQDRADAVARYLTVTYRIDADRLRAIGHGGERPLARKPNEGFRHYMGRLARVELRLMAEVY